MNQIFAMIVPSIVSIKLYEKLDGKLEKNYNLVERFLKSVLMINLINYIILVYIVNQKEFIFTNQFTIKYILLSIVIGIIYPVIEKIVKMNIKISFREKKEDEKGN